MTEHKIPPHVLDYLREDMQRNPPRFPRPDSGLSGDCLNGMPIYRAARAKARENAAARTHGRIRFCGAAALLAVAMIWGAVLLAHVAPLVAYHYADPFANSPY